MNERKIQNRFQEIAEEKKRYAVPGNRKKIDPKIEYKFHYVHW